MKDEFDLNTILAGVDELLERDDLPHTLEDELARHYPLTREKILWGIDGGGQRLFVVQTMLTAICAYRDHQDRDEHAQAIAMAACLPGNDPLRQIILVGGELAIGLALKTAMEVSLQAIAAVMNTTAGLRLLIDIQCEEIFDIMWDGAVDRLRREGLGTAMEKRIEEVREALAEYERLGGPHEVLSQQELLELENELERTGGF